MAAVLGGGPAGAVGNSDIGPTLPYKSWLQGGFCDRRAPACFVGRPSLGLRAPERAASSMDGAAVLRDRNSTGDHHVTLCRSDDGN